MYGQVSDLSIIGVSSSNIGVSSSNRFKLSQAEIDIWPVALEAFDREDYDECIEQFEVRF